MPDTTALPAVPPTEDAASATALADLASRVRKHRIWLTVLTVFVVLGTLLMCAAASFYAWSFGGFVGMSTSVTEEQVESTRQEFEDGFGAKIERLDVRVVSVGYGMVQFPYSLLDGSDEESVYVECQLKGSDVLIADLVGVAYGYDATSSGMIPTEGSLESRMTEAQFEGLLKAFAAETRAPLGSVLRYNDQPDMMYDGTTPPEIVVVNGTEYRTVELWSAMEGTLIEGDSLDMSNTNYMRDALVFHENPETGEFTYLGTDSVSAPW